MTARLRFLLAACFVLAGSVIAQDSCPCPVRQCTDRAGEACPAPEPDLAALAPAHTLAYLELHQPDKLVQEIHALFRGSLLQDPGRIIARARRSDAGNIEQAQLCAAFSPEILDDLADCKGGLVALTGLASEARPQIVAILRTGRSRLIPLAMRVYLASDDDIRNVGHVEGVAVYQVGERKTLAVYRASSFGAVSGAMLGRALTKPAQVCCYPPGDSSAGLSLCRPADESAGLYLAQLPGALVAGSSRAAVTDAIRRLKGKSKGPSLADTRGYQEALSLRTAPGLFAYADAPRLYRLLKVQVRKQAAGDRQTAQQWKMLQALLNPTAVRFVAGTFSLQKGECRSCLEVRTRQGQSIPALDWLADQKLSDDLLRTVPRDAFFVLAMPISEKLRCLDFCENIDRLHDQLALAFDLPAGPSKGTQKDDPSEASESTESSSAGLNAREIEKRMEMHVGKDVLTRIHALALAGGFRRHGQGGVSCTPVVLVEAVSEKAAEELEKLWPRLHSLGGSVAQPRVVKVRDQTVQCLTPRAGRDGQAAPASSPLPAYYGRCGKVLVLGWQAGRVAAALRAPEEDRPLLSLPQAQAAALKNDAGLHLVLSCRQLLRQTCSLLPGDEDASTQCAHSQLRRMSRAMKEAPPTLFLVKHVGNRYCCEIRQSEMQTAAAPVINALVRMLLVSKSSWQAAPVCAPPSGTIIYPPTSATSAVSPPTCGYVPAPPAAQEKPALHWWELKNGY